MSRWYRPPKRGELPTPYKSQWTWLNSYEWEFKITPWRGGSWIAFRRSPNGQPWWERTYPVWVGSAEDLMEVVVDEMLGMLPGGGGLGGGQFRDEPFSKDYPRIWWLLTVERLPDGTIRKRAAMSFSVQPDGWACFLNEKQTDHYLCRSGASQDDCLVAIELALSEQPVAWRTNGKPGKRR